MKAENAAALVQLIEFYRTRMRGERARPLSLEAELAASIAIEELKTAAKEKRVEQQSNKSPLRIVR